MVTIKGRFTKPIAIAEVANIYSFTCSRIMSLHGCMRPRQHTHTHGHLETSVYSSLDQNDWLLRTSSIYSLITSGSARLSLLCANPWIHETAVSLSMDRESEAFVLTVFILSQILHVEAIATPSSFQCLTRCWSKKRCRSADGIHPLLRENWQKGRQHCSLQGNIDF